MFGWLSRLIRGDTSGLKDPKDWLRDLITGDGSASGVTVNSKSALSVVYAGVNRISGDVAKLPLHLYERTDDGKVRAKKHPAYYLMRRKPNPELAAYYFLRAALYNAILHGNFYAYISRDGNYRPTEIVPLDSARTWPVRVDGQLWYITRVGGEERERKLSPANVFHVRGLASDGIMGLSLVDVAKETLGLTIAAERYGSVFFGSNATPTGLLEYPTKLDADVVKRIREQWKALHKGVDKANIAVLDKGVTFKPLAMQNDQAQFLATRKFQRQEIAAILNIPAHMLGDETRTSFSSLEAENQNYLESTLEPWLTAIEFECFDKLLTEREKRSGDWFFEFLRAALLKPTTDKRYEIYTRGIQWGILSPDDAREIEGLNKRPDGYGDQYLVPKNFSVAGEEKETPPPVPPPAPSTPPAPPAPPAPEDSLEAHRKLLTNALLKLIRWEVDAVNRATNKKNFVQAVEKFYESHQERMIRDLGPVVECVSAVTGEEYNLRAAVEDYCSTAFDDLLIISGAIDSANLSSSIEEISAKWSDERLALVDNILCKPPVGV